MLKKSLASLVIAGLGLAAIVLSAPPATAGSHEAKARAAAESQFKVWAVDPVVISAIKEQNAIHVNLSKADIDKMDKEWRAQKKSGDRPLIEAKMSNVLAKFLKGVKSKSGGLITEVFVMDNKGLNVGQTDPTGDFMQGDEAKWQKTYGVGAGAVHISGIEVEEGLPITQVSVAITDPGTLKVIGAVTVGVNANKLK